MPDPMNSPSRDPVGFRRVLFSSMLGTAIEWYDFFLYGTAAALVFNRLFFPQLDPLTGTLASFGSYAVGFFARPLGGIIFGHFGDRVGRKSTLVTTPRGRVADVRPDRTLGAGAAGAAARGAGRRGRR